MSIASNKENDEKLPGQNPSFPSVKTSPIVSAPATKVVSKRKKRQSWSKEVSTIAEYSKRHCKDNWIVVGKLSIESYQFLWHTISHVINPFLSIIKEDGVLVELMGKGSDVHELKWPHIAAEINQIFGSDRTGKQCRERWLNHLRPDIKKGDWTVDEEFMIKYFYKAFGPK